MKRLIFIITLGLIFTGITSSVQAHILWLNVNNYAPKAGETIWLEVGFGHKYPRDELMKKGRLERVYAVSPDGRETAVEKIFPAFYKFTPKAQGTYMIVAVLKPGFVSKTTDGRKLGNKKNLKDVVSCFAFRMTALAAISVGAKSDFPFPKTDKILEILPLKNPAGLQTGDILLLGTSFQGKPLAGTTLTAFCRDCATDKEHSWAQESESNSEGIVRIKLTSGGPWMFTTTHEVPYPDPDECDNYLYRTSLTVGF
jgi:uncharacterized GH25 family protein